MGKCRTLDVRGLEAPEPLEKILDMLETMSSDEQLEIIHWREPLLLYPVLEQLGWRYQTRRDEKTAAYLICIWNDS